MKKSIFGALLLGGLAVGGWWGRKKMAELGPVIPDVADDTLRLYQFSYSPFCIKIRHILAYKNIPYQTIELTPILHSAWTKRKSGQSKVPYIEHRGQVLNDSSVIAQYLEQLYPAPPLLPSQAVPREQVLFLEDWLDEALQPALGKLTYLTLAQHPQNVIDDPSISTGISFLDQYKAQIVPFMLKRAMRKQGLTFADQFALEKRLAEVLSRLQALLGEHPYLVGEQLTLADIALVAHLDSIDKLPFLVDNPQYDWLFAYRNRIQAELQPVTEREMVGVE